MPPPSYNNVNATNVDAILLAIAHLVATADFLAFDCEFSGLGDHKQSRNQDISKRYKYLVQLVDSRALIAFGLCVFTKDAKVHTFNFQLLSTKEFVVDPSSLQFLSENNFDFIAQYRNGIAFTPGNQGGTLVSPMEKLFAVIVQARKPIIVHNGFLDLMFIYHSFHAALPKDLDSFIADLTVIFPSGIWDTKYTSDFVDREEASFLAYLYRKYERRQAARPQPEFKFNVQGRLLPATKQLETRDTSIDQTSTEPANPYCKNYANHGYCKVGKACRESHDLDIILNHRDPLKKRKVAPNDDQEYTISVSSTSHSQSSIPVLAPVLQEASISSLPSSFETYHSACFDAFMTAYVFAYQRIAHAHNLEDHWNRLYLMGKDVPLRVIKSPYAKHGKHHTCKWEALQREGYVEINKGFEKN